MKILKGRRVHQATLVVITIDIVAFALMIQISAEQILLLALMTLLSAVPVALPPRSRRAALHYHKESLTLARLG